MTWTEMMAMPDYPESTDLENNETKTNPSSSGQTTPTPSLHRPFSPKCKTSTTVHNINVNYRHTYSVEKKNGDEVDIPALLQSLANHTSLQSPSTSLKGPKSTTDDSDILSETKKRSLVMANLSQPLIFTALDISDPPHLKYSDNMDG